MLRQRGKQQDGGLLKCSLAAKGKQDNACADINISGRLHHRESVAHMPEWLGRRVHACGCVCVCVRVCTCLIERFRRGRRGETGDRNTVKDRRRGEIYNSPVQTWISGSLSGVSRLGKRRRGGLGCRLETQSTEMGRGTEREREWQRKNMVNHLGFEGTCTASTRFSCKSQSNVLLCHIDIRR